jgi:hypothetical protein
VFGLVQTVFHSRPVEVLGLRNAKSRLTFMKRREFITLLGGMAACKRVRNSRHCLTLVSLAASQRLRGRFRRAKSALTHLCELPTAAKKLSRGASRTATSDALYDFIGIEGLLKSSKVARVVRSVPYIHDLSAARTLQFGSHRSTAFTFNRGLRSENLLVQSPCDRRSVEYNERQREDRTPQRTHGFHPPPHLC